MKKRKRNQRNSNEKQNRHATSKLVRNAETKRRVTRYLNVKRSVLGQTANQLRKIRSKSVDTSYLIRPLLSRSNSPLVTRSTVSSPVRQHDISDTYNLGRKIPSKNVVKCRFKIADSVRRSNFFRARKMGDASIRPAHNRSHTRIC